MHSSRVWFIFGPAAARPTMREIIHNKRHRRSRQLKRFAQKSKTIKNKKAHALPLPPSLSLSRAWLSCP